MQKTKHDYYIFLLLVFIVAWIYLAFNVSFRHDWWLENILVFVFVPIIIWSYFKFRLSKVSYTLITIFMLLHIYGAHYTYAETPLGYWLKDILNLSRNHYDRIVHFSFGFLLAYPVREVFMRIARTKGFWSYYLPLDLTLSFSALYEIIEWITAITAAPAAGSAFLGTQGDIWDAQKDMLCAGIGALLAMLIILLINARFQRGFWREFKESFKVKIKKPLGEEKLKEYLKA